MCNSIRETYFLDAIRLSPAQMIRNMHEFTETLAALLNEYTYYKR